jgi:16S rRNA (guanine966-N2)-methyltransferase
MRVIAGRAKGIQLQAVPGGGTRPISDRVKEALFNILGNTIVGSQVLEKHPRALTTIQANLHRTRLQDRARVTRADVFTFLAGDPTPFDLIYIAPPQYQGLWKKTLLALEASPGWLHPDGLAIVQIFPKELEPLVLDTLRLTEQRKYGSTLLCFYEPIAPNP